MAKDYSKISKYGWTCVQSKLGILCHRDKRPCESVALFKNEVLIVDAVACETKKTDTHRTHTQCIFREEK